MASPESMTGQKDTCPDCGNVTIVPAPRSADVNGPRRDASAAPQGAEARNGPPGGNSFAPRHSGQIVGVERTSKSLKLQRLLAVLTVAIGVAMAIAGCPAEDGRCGPAFPFGLLLAFAGSAWLVTVRILRWWRHG